VVGDHKGFTVVLRGYDTDEVEAMLKRIKTALASADAAVRASVRDELDRAAFHTRLRGYDRIEVDEYLRKAVDRLA
jgi:DivIVA domain-containing protein